jgi:hypothetical protein
MREPTKFPFSSVYSERGICGASGLLDQGSSDESDMYSREKGVVRKELNWGKSEGCLGARWEQGIKSYRIISTRGYGPKIKW